MTRNQASFDSKSSTNRTKKRRPFYTTLGIQVGATIAVILVLTIIGFLLVQSVFTSKQSSTGSLGKLQLDIGDLASAREAPEETKPATPKSKPPAPPPRKGPPNEPPAKDKPVRKLPPKEDPQEPKQPPPAMKGVYLSTLEPNHKFYWPSGPPESRRVKVKTKASPHGIAMQPPPSFAGGSQLGFSIAGKFRTLKAKVALNDTAPPRIASTVMFSVYGDKRLLWRSQPIRDRSQVQDCTISVKNVDTLLIEVSCSGDPKGAHAVWIEPLLE